MSVPTDLEKQSARIRTVLLARGPMRRWKLHSTARIAGGTGELFREAFNDLFEKGVLTFDGDLVTLVDRTPPKKIPVLLGRNVPAPRTSPEPVLPCPHCGNPISLVPAHGAHMERGRSVDGAWTERQ